MPSASSERFTMSNLPQRPSHFKGSNHFQSEPLLRCTISVPFKLHSASHSHMMVITCQLVPMISYKSLLGDRWP